MKNLNPKKNLSLWFLTSINQKKYELIQFPFVDTITAGKSSDISEWSFSFVVQLLKPQVAINFTWVLFCVRFFVQFFLWFVSSGFWFFFFCVRGWHQDEKCIFPLNFECPWRTEDEQQAHICRYFLFFFIHSKSSSHATHVTRMWKSNKNVI